MAVHVFSFEFVVTSGVLQGQPGTEDAHAYAYDSVDNTIGERRYRAYRVANLHGGVAPSEYARTCAREFGGRHGNVHVDMGSLKSWPLVGPPNVGPTVA
ncbi:MAG: hypothetical protein ACHREM_09805 [Polyangiales bacterium]